MRRLLFAALVLVAPSAFAQSKPKSSAMLPPEIEQRYTPDWIAAHGEPPLWTPEARRGYRTRLRMTLAGISLTRISIRIDEHDNGRIAGRILVGKRVPWNTPERVTERRFRVTRAQLDDLLRRIAATKLWHIYPEHWISTDGDSICLDGMELVMERADANGYRFSEANAQCTAPSDMLTIAGIMIDLSKQRNVRRLLD